MNIYFTFVSFVFGIILGSFYNVCIYRIPLKKSIVSPPSSCTNCGNRLNIVDLVPVFSWIFLKGKCRFCGNEVSSRYISIELLTGVIFVLIFLVFGYNISTIYYMIFSSILIVITFIDIDHLIIPDRIVI
ncbi:MAG: prepilin peptidase, partial [Peptostreptococcaceae bacterium]